MNALEKLLIHTQEQHLGLLKAAFALTDAARQLATARRTIEEQRVEITCLKMDLAEARAKG